jgi:hypothetical protein
MSLAAITAAAAVLPVAHHHVCLVVPHSNHVQVDADSKMTCALDRMHLAANRVKVVEL